MKFDSGTMVGFYSGGKSHRGLSLKNMTKLYRHALVLGGEDPKIVHKFSYHGGKRGGISFQKSFGGMLSKEVALGSKHCLGDITDEYTDANKCQLAEPMKRQCDLRDQMEAVLQAKKQHSVEEKQTPEKEMIPGEVKQEKGNISPSEVRSLNTILEANGLKMEKLREIDRWHPGFLRCILNLAAESVVGISPEGGNLVKRALKLMKAGKKKIQTASRVLNFKKILNENGLEQEKMQEIDKYHPGFSDCVLQIASNPDGEISTYGKELQKRAKSYLKNKRSKAGIKKKAIGNNIREAIGGGVNSSMKVLGVEEAYFGNGDMKERYKPKVKEFKQELNPSVAPTQPSIVYHGPVFNKCSFETNAMSKVLSSAVFGRPHVLGSQQFKKRPFQGKVGDKKRSSEVHLSLDWSYNKIYT